MLNRLPDGEGTEEGVAAWGGGAGPRRDDGRVQAEGGRVRGVPGRPGREAEGVGGEASWPEADRVDAVGGDEGGRRSRGQPRRSPPKGTKLAIGKDTRSSPAARSDAVDLYTVVGTVKLEGTITAVRVEALTDRSLPARGRAGRRTATSCSTSSRSPRSRSPAPRSRRP